MKLISSMLLVSLSSGAGARPRSDERDAAREEAKRPARHLAGAIDVEDLYRRIGEDAIESLAGLYQELSADAGDDLCAAFPDLDPEGLALAKGALMDLLGEIAHGPGSEGGADDKRLTQRTRAYGRYETYGGWYGGYGNHGGYGYGGGRHGYEWEGRGYGGGSYGKNDWYGGGYYDGYYGGYGGYYGGHGGGYGGDGDSAGKYPLRARMGRYPGYDGDVYVAGVVNVGFPRRDVTRLSFDLRGLERICTNCGVHIHAGTTCDDADEVGGHYYAVSADPWTAEGGAAYDSDWYGEASGSFDLESGYDRFHENVGHAVVIHARDGTRISCGTLSQATGLRGQQYGAENGDRDEYGGYEGGRGRYQGYGRHWWY